MKTAFRVFGFVLLSIGMAAAQQPADRAPYETLPDISGIWNRIDPVGGGSFGGVQGAFPRAELQPEYAARLPKPVPSTALPPPYNIKEQTEPTPRCGVGGETGTGNSSPTVTSGGMQLAATPDLVLMLRDGAHGGRYMFADGRPFPSRFSGLYSIGRWEKDAFVATTRGFVSGMTGIGRGWAEPSTELIETFRASANGQRLTVTHEWRDPKVYVKPHVYDVVYERLEPHLQIWESWCDSKRWIEGNAKGALKPRPEVP
jgi:hypothetical protein